MNLEYSRLYNNIRYFGRIKNIDHIANHKSEMNGRKDGWMNEWDGWMDR